MNPDLITAQETENYIIHPTILDACLQSTVSLREEGSGVKVLPFLQRRLSIPFKNYC